MPNDRVPMTERKDGWYWFRRLDGNKEWRIAQIIDGLAHVHGSIFKFDDREEIGPRIPDPAEPTPSPSATPRFPDGCDGNVCPECEAYGCPYTPGSKDLNGNVISATGAPGEADAGQKLERILSDESAKLRALATNYTREKRTDLWWRFSGYSQVLMSAASRIKAHRLRADRCYGPLPQTRTDGLSEHAGGNPKIVGWCENGHAKGQRGCVLCEEIY